MTENISTNIEAQAGLDRVIVVLIGTTHPGNIGASARAMKTMGLRHLLLVNPQHFPSAEATARASGADDVLGEAKVVASLAEAVADCDFVVGASARDRHLQWPALESRKCATRLISETRSGRVALVFGRENSGLENAELDRCHALLRIPTAGLQSSLNLGAAVQVIAYEVMLAARDAAKATTASNGKEEVLTDAVQPGLAHKQMEGFYNHLFTTLSDIGYYQPQQPKLLERRLRRIFNRVRPDRAEMNILRGILSAAQKAARHSAD